MSSPLVVVLVVALGDASDETTRTLSRTVQETLGSEAVVLLREEADLDERRVARLGDDLHASTLVVVTWTQEGKQRQAHVRLYAPRARTWTDRDVAFAPDDAPDARGRALGYGIATMVRGGAAPPPESSGPPAAPAAAAPPSAPAPAVDEAARPPREPRGSALVRLHVDARMQGAVALGDAGSSLGGEGALAYRVSRPIVIRLAAGLRGGEISAAGASASYLRLGGGLGLALLESAGPRPLALGVRVDALAIRQSASRSDSGSEGARWAAGADVVVEGAWWVLPRAAIVAGAGLEVVLEPTRILVDQREAATIAPVRTLFELGVRVGID